MWSIKPTSSGETATDFLETEIQREVVMQSVQQGTHSNGVYIFKDCKGFVEHIKEQNKKGIQFKTLDFSLVGESLTASDLKEVLQSNPDVVELDLRKCKNLSTSILNELSHLRKIEVLYLSVFKDKKQPLEIKEGQLACLKKLVFEDCRNIDLTILYAIRPLKGLEVLKFKSCPKMDNMTTTSYAPEWNELQNNRVGKNISKLGNLRSLRFKDCHISSTILDFLTKNPKLSKVKIEDKRFIFGWHQID